MRLIHRQSEIVSYLLSPGSFRDRASLEEVPAALQGLDSERLRVLGLFSLGKRQGKVSSVMPRTWAYVRENKLYDFMDFAARYPQHDAAYFWNASQYFSYLQEVWLQTTPDPSWLPDIARYEIEYAAARSAGVQCEEGDLDAQSVQGCVRRHRDVRLSRYQYDIRPILNDLERKQVPALRDVRLAFVAERSGQEVKVFELTSGVFDALSELDSWSPLDRFKLDDQVDAKKLIDQLQSLGLIEARL